MTNKDRYDVVIAGGGLAGLSLALQVKRESPDAHILVAEKSRLPNREAAHKVGESSVEAASHYLASVLGLGDLLSKELPKFGLRFFMTQADNMDITRRTECGPSHYLSVPSFQIDRGQFENALADRVNQAGVHFADGCQIDSIHLKDDAHTVSLSSLGQSRQVECRWLVDATGRAALLKKKLGLARPNRHDVNAAWFRIDGIIDPDEWAGEPVWRHRLKESRRLSTNHFMGRGYWVWLIPLANDRTSVGIVADQNIHPFEKIRSFDKAMAWMAEREPQCASVIRQHLDDLMDFRAIKNYSHDVKQVFSSDRWCLTGDSGAFIDPLYSPGSDFIGIANGFVADLISRDMRGESIDRIAPMYDQIFRSLTRTYLATYHRQYPLMGCPRIMTTKIVWDFVMYWGSIALLFRGNKFCDLAFMDRVNETLQAFAFTNVKMQSLFRKWADFSVNEETPFGSFIDYAELKFLAELNRDLTRDHEDDSLIVQLDQNLELARQLKLEIIAEASRTAALLGADSEPPRTCHLAAMFRSMQVNAAA